LHKTKLFKLIKSLSKSEFNQLEAYINSPFFLKKNKNPLKLYQALKEYAPQFDSKELTKKVIFKIVFPKVNYNDAKMRNLLSRTVKIVDSYLLYLNNEEDKFERDKRLSEIYNKRNIESEFFNYSRRLLADLEKIEQKDTSYYFNKFSLEKELYFHFENDKKNSIAILDNSLHSFHNYLALEEANMKLEIYNRQRIYKHKISIPPLPYSLQLTENNLCLQLINKINDLLTSEENKDKFVEIINEFEYNLFSFSSSDRQNIYMALQNYGVQKISKNPKSYAKIQFRIYKLGLEHQLIILNNTIVSTSYLNIVLTGIRLKKFEWVAEFIEKYEEKLNKADAPFVKKLALIYLNFDKKNFKETINLTSQTRFPDIRWELNTKTIQIRSYFELFLQDISYSVLIINQLNAFSKFIHREKSLIPSRKVGTQNFVKYLRRFTKVINKGNWTTIVKSKIKKEIDMEKNLTYRHWLLEKLK